MVAAIRQTVTVQADGKIEICDPELRAGEQAEVIVLVNAPTAEPVLSPREALKALQESLHLTPEAAREWIELARAERRAFGGRK